MFLEEAHPNSPSLRSTNFKGRNFAFFKRPSKDQIFPLKNTNCGASITRSHDKSDWIIDCKNIFQKLLKNCKHKKYYYTCCVNKFKLNDDYIKILLTYLIEDVRVPDYPITRKPDPKIGNFQLPEGTRTRLF